MKLIDKEAFIKVLPKCLCNADDHFKFFTMQQNITINVYVATFMFVDQNVMWFFIDENKDTIITCNHLESAWNNL